MNTCSSLVTTRSLAYLIACVVCVIRGHRVQVFRHEDLSSETQTLATLLYASSLPPSLRPQAFASQGGHRAQMQFSPFKTIKKPIPSPFKETTQQSLRKAWKKADAYRPGEPNVGVRPKGLADLHRQLKPRLESLESQGEVASIPGARNATSLLGALLKQLATGDMALSLCSKEAPVLKDLREWLVEKLDIKDAIRGLPEEQGRVLSTVAVALDARKILDLGTFTGYSSIAMALPTASDAKIVCSEKDPKWAKEAKKWWKKANCEDKMEMRVEEAEVVMQDMIDNGEVGSVDLIFCDVDEREKYTEIHEKAMQLLRVGGMIIYYDTLWAAENLGYAYFPAMQAFNKLVTTDPRVICSLVPLSYGITICTKTMTLDSAALEEAKSAAHESDRNDLLRKLLLERRAAVEAEREALGI